MKRLFLISCMIAGTLTGVGQVNWADSDQPNKKIRWSNYSTSYIGEEKDSVPLLVIAIPYNGIYDMNDRTEFDMDFAGSAFRFRSNLEDRYKKMFTHSPDDVYFMVPGIFKRNADAYEFRVVKDDSTEIKPWSDITQFVSDDFRINALRPGFGFLGGYRTAWDHYIVVELRKKGATSLTAASVVYWKSSKPQLVNIFSANELNELLLKKKRPYAAVSVGPTPDKWKQKYTADQMDSLTMLPKKLYLEPDENSPIFVVSADVFKKEALIYSLVKNGKTYRPAGPNEYDNNMIALKDLSPGNYLLQISYAMQPEHITAYPFEIKAAWYQTVTFKVLSVIILAGALFSVILLLKLRRQQRKMIAEQAKKEQLRLGLKTIHSQLNPHFIFNALSSIQGLINNNDITGANRYLADFGTLIRHALTESDREFIPLIREIETLNTYLKLEQLRFNFSYAINLDKEIETATTELPSLLLQPLVENAVKHGVSSNPEKGVISVNIIKEAADMKITIHDNGQGFDTAKQSAGYGLKLTRDRIHLLNEMNPDLPISMQISGNLQTGTTIELLFKNALR